MSINRKLPCLEWEERDVPCAFDGAGEHPLMMCAGACDTAGQDFPLFRDKPANPLDVLIVNHFHLFHAEGTDLSLKESPPALIRLRRMSA